jgi:hypothetical protein
MNQMCAHEAEEGVFCLREGQKVAVGRRRREVVKGLSGGLRVANGDYIGIER